jgi:aminopeptidase N
MENWGLVTYRETALLSNVTVSSSTELQRVAVVVAHELGHFFFGDLVTMSWWDALWLNEGFATLVEYIGADRAEPAYQMLRQFQSGDIFTAQSSTMWGTSRSLTSYVDSSEEIEAQFDGVAYSFGGSILYSVRAFVEAIVPGSFFQGVAIYLQQNKYSNAQPVSLWNALAASSGVANLPTYMGGYEHNVGYPLLQVSWADPASISTGVGTLVLSQSRHFYSAVAKLNAPSVEQNYAWWIPLKLKGQTPGVDSPVPAAVARAFADKGFTTQTWAYPIGSLAQPFNLTRDGWLIANANATGFYRVNYPSNLWAVFGASIVTQLMANNASTFPLTNMERAQLLEDIWTFAEGGIDSTVNIPLALQFSTFLQYETAYEVWQPAVSHLSNLRQLLFSDNGSVGTNAVCLANLDKYISKQITPLVSFLGFDNGDQSPLTVQTRASLLSLASVVNISSVVQGAFTYWAKGAVNVPVNIQTTVFNSVVRWSPIGDPTNYDEMRLLYQTTVDATTKLRYLRALASAKDPALLNQTLYDSIDPSKVRSQDTVTVITAVASNTVGRGLAWNFVKANWPLLNARYGTGGFSLSSLVQGTAQYFSSTAFFNDITAFSKVNPIPAAVIPLGQALESLQTRANWETTDLADTCAWLSTYSAENRL